MRHAVLALALGAAFVAGCGKASASSKWADHKGDIPFVVGQAAGMRIAESTGRPPMYFFTATW